MPPAESKPSEQNGLIIRPEEALALLRSKNSSALSEIIGRALVHIRASTSRALPERIAGEECEFEIAPGVKMVMCWIPPGEFHMGSPEDEEGRRDDETQHLVRITQGFWLAKTQTTQAQWQAVMGNNPSYFNGDDLPVENVSWIDICGNESGTGGFLGALNKRLPTGGRFYLPTEAQWEYACRAGTTGPYAGNLDEIAWYVRNSYDKTHPVGHKMPNAWGLHDIFGNVCEWCFDWDGDYDLGVVTDPIGPASGSSRVLRGGGWFVGASDCRVAVRGNYYPANGNRYFGFRVARSLVP
jgi:formylglycine-generating enzyme required for sulfatase activity